MPCLTQREMAQDVLEIRGAALPTVAFGVGYPALWTSSGTLIRRKGAKPVLVFATCNRDTQRQHATGVRDAFGRGSSLCISWYQNQLILTTCCVRCRITLWDNRSPPPPPVETPPLKCPPGGGGGRAHHLSLSYELRNRSNLQVRWVKHSVGRWRTAAHPLFRISVAHPQASSCLLSCDRKVPMVL